MDEGAVDEGAADEGAALFEVLAAAYVRGALAEGGEPPGPPLEELGGAELAALAALGRARGLRLHRFKRTMGLPRVAKVLGVLRGLAPADLLDIGSGRGAFLWPLLDAMPHLPVTAVDTLPHRVADMRRVAAGGVARLTPLLADATRLPIESGAHDVVTMLEVLEHIPDAGAALSEALRVARRFLVLSVPSKPDDNPEHIHLFDAPALERMLLERGAARVALERVPGHTVAVVRVAR